MRSFSSLNESESGSEVNEHLLLMRVTPSMTSKHLALSCLLCAVPGSISAVPVRTERATARSLLVFTSTQQIGLKILSGSVHAVLLMPSMCGALSVCTAVPKPMEEWSASGTVFVG